MIWTLVAVSAVWCLSALAGLGMVLHFLAKSHVSDNAKALESRVGLLEAEVEKTKNKLSKMSLGGR